MVIFEKTSLYSTQSRQQDKEHQNHKSVDSHTWNSKVVYPKRDQGTPTNLMRSEDHSEDRGRQEERPSRQVGMLNRVQREASKILQYWNRLYRYCCPF